jgi:hypothetical protein
MRPAQRFLAIGIVIGLVEAALGLLVADTVLAAYLILCGATSVAFAIAAHRLLDGPPRPPGENGGPGDDPTDPPPPEPPWWPEFEAQFRAHVQERVRPHARV